MAIKIGTGTGTEIGIGIGTLQAQTAIPTTIGTLTTTGTQPDQTGTLMTATQHPTTLTDTLQIVTRTTDTHLELDLIGTLLKDIQSIATPLTGIPQTDTRQELDTHKHRSGFHKPSTATRPE